MWAANIPGIGVVAARCRDGEPIRCLGTALLGTIPGRYAWFRGVPQHIRLYRAGVSHMVKTDLSGAYVHALWLASHGEVCLDNQGHPCPRELCRCYREWDGEVEFDRYYSVRQLADSLRGVWLAVTASDAKHAQVSEWARYWQWGHGECSPDYFSDYTAAVKYLYRNRCTGQVIRARDLLKYAVLTQIGYSYYTGAAWMFSMAVSLTTWVIQHVVDTYNTKVYATYVDSVIADDYTYMPWPHKREAEGQGTVVLPGLYRVGREYGLWGLGACDMRVRPEALAPWAHINITGRDPDWLYKLAVRAFSRYEPKCEEEYGIVRNKAVGMGVEWWPGYTPVDHLAGVEREF